MIKYISLVCILHTIYAQNQQTNVSLAQFTNLTLPLNFSSGVAYIYNNHLNLIGGRNQVSPEKLIQDKKYSLDLSSLSFTNDINGKLVIDTATIETISSWTEAFIDYPHTQYMNYSKEGITLISQLSTTVADRLYIVSPEDYYSNNDLLIFDMKNDIFVDMNTYSEDLPYGSVEACVANNNTHIFAIGGWRYRSGNTYHNKTQIYSIKYDRWSQGGEMSQTKGCMGCTADKNLNIYTFGGWGPNPLRYIDRIEKYNTSVDSWSVVSVTLQTKIMYPRCVLDEITNKNYIYCMGGVVDGFTASRFVHIFDSNTETVKYNPVGLIDKNKQFSALTYRFNNDNNGLMLIMGGFNDVKDLNSIEYNILKAPDNYQPTPKPTQFPTANIAVFHQMDYNIKLPLTIGEAVIWIYDGILNIMGGRKGSGAENLLRNTRYSFNISSINFTLINSGSYYLRLDEQNIAIQGGFMWTQHFQSSPPDANNLFRNYTKEGYICGGQCFTKLNEYLYIYAPVDSVENKNLLKYNMMTNEFVDTSTYEANSQYRATGACIISDGNRKIYVTGGYYWDGYRPFTQIYDVNSNFWNLGSEFNQQRGFHACAFNINYSYLYIIAGYENIDNFYNYYYNSIEKYDISNDKWTTIKATTQYGLFGPQCILDRIQTGYIWCTGGYDYSIYVETVHVLNPITDQVWHFEQGLVEGVVNHHVLMYNIPTLSTEPKQGILFAFGGYDNNHSNIDIIQYIGLRQIPTTSPTKNPTNIPTITPTIIPTDTPTINPGLTPTAAPIQLDTSSIYFVLSVMTDVAYGDILQENYQDAIIQSIISVILKSVELKNDYLQLFYRTILRCDKDQTKSEWKYFVMVATESMSTLQDFITSNAGMDRIGETMQNITNSYYILQINTVNLLNIAFENEYNDQCDDIVVTETLFETTDAVTNQDESDMSVLETSGFATMSYFVLAAAIILPIILVIIAFFVHASKTYKGSDSPKYLTVFNYFANVGDFWSDILFAFHLNALNSYLFLFAAIFTFIPYIFGIILLIAFILMVRGSKNSYAYIAISKYL